MVLIEASLLHKGVRQSGIVSGYRPLIFFLPDNPTSGEIRLLDREVLLPAETAIVKITLPDDRLLGTAQVGQRFKIGESPDSIVGEIEILQIDGKWMSKQSACDPVPTTTRSKLEGDK